METILVRRTVPFAPIAIALATLVALVAGCAEQPRQSQSRPAAERAERPRQPQGQLVKVSWYGANFAGKPTASGEPYDPEELTLAHRTLPLGTRVRITNPENGKSVVARVNDRGPFVAGRTADLSRAAARQLGILEDGVGQVRLQVVDSGDRAR
jgi:rare lipoprotein A